MFKWWWKERNRSEIKLWLIGNIPLWEGWNPWHEEENWPSWEEGHHFHFVRRKDKGWAQVQVGLQMQVTESLLEGLYFLREAGAKTSAIREGWDGGTRPWEKMLKMLVSETEGWVDKRTVGFPRGGGGLRVSGDDDKEDSAKLGDFFSLVLCCLRDVKKVYCWVLPELLPHNPQS